MKRRDTNKPVEPGADMSATITNSKGTKVEIEAGDFIVAIQGPREEWDFGTVESVDRGYVGIAWQSGGTSDHPIRTLDGADLYTSWAAARKDFERALGHSLDE
jgi:hypothetical protein